MRGHPQFSSEQLNRFSLREGSWGRGDGEWSQRRKEGRVPVRMPRHLFEPSRTSPISVAGLGAGQARGRFCEPRQESEFGGGGFRMIDGKAPCEGGS